MHSAPMRLILLAAGLLTGYCDEYEFWEACAAGDTSTMAHLLEEAASDIDLDYPDEDGRTPLLLAAATGDVQIIDDNGAATFIPYSAMTPPCFPKGVPAGIAVPVPTGAPSPQTMKV